MFRFDQTVYRGSVKGKVIGFVWPGPVAVDGVITLPEWGVRPTDEAPACLVQFGRRTAVVPVGELSRVMPMPVRVVAMAMG